MSTGNKCIKSTCPFYRKLDNGNRICNADGVPVDFYIQREKCQMDMGSYEKKKVKNSFYDNFKVRDTFFGYEV